MGREVPVSWDDIPESSLVPDGGYLLRIELLEETASAEAGKLMYKATHRVVEPEAFKDQPVYDNFVIGSAEDPAAEAAETWLASIGAKRMKTMLKKAGVPLDNDMDVVCAAAEGQMVHAIISQQKTQRGSTLNQINSYQAPGTGEIGVTTGAEQEEKPAAKPKPAAPAKPGVKPSVPAKPAAAAKPAAPAKPAPAKPAAGVKCSICEAVVPRAQFAAHVQTHEEE